MRSGRVLDGMLPFIALAAAAGCGCRCPAAAAPPAHSGAAPPRDEAGLLSRYEGVPPVDVQKGKAVWYGDALAGRKTASGEVFEPRRYFTAAHRTLPFDTVVRVVRLDTDRYVYVRINDRGPFGDDRRIIDLSRLAAERLHMIRAGVVDVRLEVVEYGPGR